MQLKYHLPGLALLTMLVFYTNAHACSCAGGGTPCQAFGEASAVFVGTVTSVKTSAREKSGGQEIDWTPRTFTFAVEQSFAGIEGAHVEVATGSGGGDCGYNFITGTRYLVYAYRSGEGSRLTTGTCTRTTPYTKANEDIQFLNTLRSIGPGVTIQGAVKRQLHSVKGGSARTISPVADALLVIESGGERKEVRTDADGRYQLSGMPAGKYKITLLLPELVTSHAPEQERTVAERGCAVVDYYVSDNGRISGKVFDADGQPVKGVLVTLVEVDGQDLQRHYGKLERTDQDGRYNFSAVPPGRYLIALNLTRFPQVDDPTNAYPRTYYPGVPHASMATTINLEAGEKSVEHDMRLLPRRAASVIQGTVVWADGTPVPNADISFRDVTYFDSNLNNALKADGQGRFTINGFEGLTFLIAARSDRAYVGEPRRFEPMERTTPVRIILGRSVEPVKIVITKLR